jgi:hypothetical protein
VAGESHEIIRDFTKARKFPNLIGRTPDGKRLIGGPYTITQFVGGGGVAAVLYVFRGLWMHFDTITNTVLFIVPVIGTVFILGKLRLAGRSPVSMLSGVLTAVTAPKHAPINGYPVKTRMPVLVLAGGHIQPYRLAEDTPAPTAKAPVRTANPAALPARYAALTSQTKPSPPAVRKVVAAQTVAPLLHQPEPAATPAAPAPKPAPPRDRRPTPPRNEPAPAVKPASLLGVKGLLAVADKNNGRAER